MDAKRGKDELRREFKRIRSEIPAEERERIDGAIADAVIALPSYAAADVLFAYLSFGSEIDTRPIIEHAWENGKTVALPRCVPGTRRMEWFRVESFEGLVKSKLGVEEPAPDPSRAVDPAAHAHALALVPGLTFDERGYRLGYGGGFYDVFLSGFPGVSVGLCRRCQMSHRVEALDSHDLPVDIVVTD